jgi:hypothetical protein
MGGGGHCSKVVDSVSLPCLDLPRRRRRTPRHHASLRQLLLDRGFQAVNLLPDVRCRPWPYQSRISVLRRIEADWRTLKDEGLLGYRYWFDLPDTVR